MKKLSLSVFALLVGVASSASAEETILWDGWLNIQPCSRVEWYTDDLGIRWPKPPEVAPQELHGQIFMAQTLEEVAKNRVATCVAQGVASAGFSAIMTSGAAAWPTFVTAFNACLTGEGLAQLIGNTISIRYDTSCRW